MGAKERKVILKTAQPFIESRMNDQYQYVIPAEAYEPDGLVMRYYQFNIADCHVVYPFPDCCPSIVFFYDDSKLLSVKFKGTHTFVVKSLPPAYPVMFGIDLFPGAVSAVADVCARDFNDLEIDIPSGHPAVFMQRFIDKMRYAGSFKQRVSISDSFLLEHREWINRSIQPIRQFFSCGETVKVEERANQIGYSSRHVRRLFDYYVGCSPKQAEEIVRFRNSFHTIMKNPEYALNHIAWDNNYYDLSHMYRSYQKISGFSPLKLLNLILPPT